MRLLQVIQQLETGGAERVVVSLLSAAEAAGHEVALAAAPGRLSREIACERFDLPIVERRPSRVAEAAWKLRGAVRRWRPDLVHCHNPAMGLAAAIATRRGSRPPALVSVHGVPDEDYVAASRVLRWAGVPVTACGPGVSEALREHGVRVRATIVNGVSPAPAPADRGRIARELGLREDLALVVSVGRLVRQKNQQLAIRAMPDVPAASLAVLGEGPLRPELERVAHEAGVADRVSFAGARSDARAIVGAADALVITSHWEGLPLVALEGLTAGVPVVATAVRGVAELLTDGVDSVLVAPDHAAAVADGLVRVLTDRHIRSRIVTGGARLAGAHTEEAMTTRYLALYEEIVRPEASAA